MEPNFCRLDADSFKSLISYLDLVNIKVLSKQLGTIVIWGRGKEKQLVIECYLFDSVLDEVTNIVEHVRRDTMTAHDDNMFCKLSPWSFNTEHAGAQSSDRQEKAYKSVLYLTYRFMGKRGRRC